MAELGLLGLPYPEEYDGGGGDYLSYAIAVEEVARACGSTALIYAAHVSLGCGPIYYFGNEEQKEKWLPRLCSGQGLGAFGLTEPEAGSDAGATRTTAVRDGDRLSAQWQQDVDHLRRHRRRGELHSQDRSSTQARGASPASWWKRARRALSPARTNPRWASRAR